MRSYLKNKTQIEYDLKNIHHSLLSLVLGRVHLTLRGKNISSQWPSGLGAHQLISPMWSPVRWRQLLFLKHWKISSCEGYLKAGGSHFKPGSVTVPSYVWSHPPQAKVMPQSSPVWDEESGCQLLLRYPQPKCDSLGNVSRWGVDRAGGQDLYSFVNNETDVKFH